ncbi:MAG TPA: alpha/beta hydrolase [Stellaceae bacterium]|nr:alpha/beta hydrolase [Stellaceae bacterium]
MSQVIEEKAVELGGGPLYYREAGQGKTIVFLHGAGGAPPRGASFVAMLAERHRLIIPSRPGFDETPVGACKTLLDVVDRMAEFIQCVAPAKVHLVAQSAGGAIGCWLAIRHPALVESLVLSAPAAFAVRHGPPGGAPPPMEAIEKRLYGDHPSWSEPPTEGERQRIARNARENMGRFSAPEGNSDLRARLSEIAVPTLLICATGDEMVPEAALEPYQESIPHCTRILIHGAAHEMPIAAAPQWVKLVADFVDRGEYFVVNMG